MVNTVGSLETKYWQSKWIDLKKSLVLTLEQRSLIAGSLLGDGTMRLGEGARNANYKVEQGLVQKSYVFWKYKLLKSFVPAEPKLSYRYDSVKGKYPKSWWFRTVRHPLLTEIYHLWYVGDEYRTGRKIVPKTIEGELTPLALAVWIMDDGSYSRGTITISTYSLTTDEIEMLCDALRNRYGIKARYHRDRDKGYRMYCNQSETKRLVETITPYIIPSMMYKIGIKTP
jgi:recombination protein RecA